MRTKRTFQPAANEALEDRSVPSAAGGLTPLVISVPAQDARLVVQAFDSFSQSYQQDVTTVLLAPGTTNPATNRANFDAVVGIGLTNLNSTIDTAIGNLSTASSLGVEIQSELLGPGALSLQTRLGELPTPKVATLRANRTFSAASNQLILESAFYINREVATAPASTPSGAITAATFKAEIQAIRTAFQAFSHTYDSDVNSILLPAGTTNPSSNRPAFDSAVGTALASLNSRISLALSSLPNSVATSLATTVQNDLLTGTQTTGLDLQSRLASLASPTSRTGATPWLFRVGSTLNITFAQSEMVSQVQQAVASYNSSI